MSPQLKKQLTNLPDQPGIYRFYDQDNNLLYIGKAKNLKNRVKSYFVDRHTSPKTRILVSQIDRLETIIVASEIDALILEANQIHQHKPPYNIILKDDKSHVYIKITTYQDFPIISTCRQTDMELDRKALYFGPYPSGRIVRQTLRQLRKVFPYIAHRPPTPPGRRRPKQSFFYYNLNLTGINPNEDWDKNKYRQQVFQLVHFLQGKRINLTQELTKEMQVAAKQLAFEQAAEIKSQIENLNYLASQKIAPDDYIQNPELMAEKRQQGLDQLSEALQPYFTELHGTEQQLHHPLHRIECYDISNTMGQYSVGSMVVFIEGDASKAHYRKFRIKQNQAPNDVAMIKEVLTRRLKRLKKNTGPTDQSFSGIPSLLMIDGGKGQLNAAIEVMQQQKLNIPVVGMTKREEELILRTQTIQEPLDSANTNVQPHRGNPNRSGAHGAIVKTEADLSTTTNQLGQYLTIRLARGSEALFLIQRIRDEAHRFAIQYHKQLRSKAFLPDKKK